MAQEERREEEGKVEAQEGHEGKEEMTTHEECVEAKKETNSMHEESDVSNRHMTWWRDAWLIRMDGGPHMRTARGRPNRPATTTGWKRPRAQPKRQRERNGEGRNGSKREPEEKKATPCTLSSTSQREQLQPLQQVQQQQQRQPQLQRRGRCSEGVRPPQDHR